MRTPTTASKAERALTHRRVAPAFKRIFHADSKDVKVFIVWLAKLTHATESTLYPDAHETIAASAKREIWLAFQNELAITEQDIRDMQSYVASLGEE